MTSCGGWKIIGNIYMHDSICLIIKVKLSQFVILNLFQDLSGLGYKKENGL
jgi:hypothetical protein